MTPDKLVEELDRVVKVPGLSNVWVPPIRNRIDMLATGIKSPVGIKVAGADLATIDRLTTQIEAAVKSVPGVSSALAERLTGGRYIDVDVDRAGRGALRPLGRRRAGGRLDGHRRRQRRRGHPGARALSDQRALPARDPRLAASACAQLPFVTDKGATAAAAGRRARSRIEEGPPMLRSENARLSGWVYVDVRGRDLRSVVNDMQAAVAEAGDDAGRLRGVVVRPVRVPGARDRAAEARRAGHAGGHLRAAVPAVPVVRATPRW